jgi:hypothetical protein
VLVVAEASWAEEVGVLEEGEDNNNNNNNNKIVP